MYEFQCIQPLQSSFSVHELTRLPLPKPCISRVHPSADSTVTSKGIATHPQLHADPSLHTYKCYPTGKLASIYLSKKAPMTICTGVRLSTTVNFVSNFNRERYSHFFCFNLIIRTHPPLCHMQSEMNHSYNSSCFKSFFCLFSSLEITFPFVPTDGPAVSFISVQ